MTRSQYTVICRRCQKVVMRTRSVHRQRPVRYGECNICKPVKKWNYHNAPVTGERP